MDPGALEAPSEVLAVLPWCTCAGACKSLAIFQRNPDGLNPI